MFRQKGSKENWKTEKKRLIPRKPETENILSPWAFPEDVQKGAVGLFFTQWSGRNVVRDNITTAVSLVDNVGWIWIDLTWKWLNILALNRWMTQWFIWNCFLFSLKWNTVILGEIIVGFN